MDDERRAKEIGETAEERSQKGAGRYIILFFIYLIGIVASVIYWIISIILWLGAWLIAWVGFIVIFCVMWVVNIFRPMPKEWGYRYIDQEDWFLTSDELKAKHSG
jgi:Flp pilus assembly protein TadB